MRVSSRGVWPRVLRSGVVRFAGCLAFLLSLMTATAGAQIAYNGSLIDLGSVTIGGTATTATATFSVAAGQTATVTSTTAVSLGAVLQDYSIVSQNCTAAILTGPTTCSVTVAFSPVGPGVRLGAIVLRAGTQPAVTAFLRGTGVGSELVLSPNTAASNGNVAPLQPTSFVPSSVNFDAAGNLYFNDILNGRILEQSANGTLATVVSLPGTVFSSFSIAGNGNLYVTSPSEDVVYLVVPGVAPTATRINISGVNLVLPSGIAADADGGFYLTDAIANTLIHSTPAGAATLVTLTGLGTPLSGPLGLALDGQGNLYIADSGNNRVVKVVLATGAASVVPVNGLFLFNPYGVTVDASGTLYVADTGNRRMVRVLPTGAAQSLMVNGFAFSSPTASTLAANGDLVVADSKNGLTRIYRTAPAPTVTFATATPVGTLDSADGARSFGVQNIGNAPLQLVSVDGVAATANPTIGNPAFTIALPTTCPVVTATTSATDAQIASGVLCLYAINFTPSVTGVNFGFLNLTTHATGAQTNASNSVTLTGTGAGAIDAFTVVAPATATAGTPVSFTVTAKGGGVTSTGFTGTVVLTSTDGTAVFPGGNTYTFTAADNGVHTFTAPASGITFNAAGTFQVRVTSGGVTGVSNNVVVNPNPVAVAAAFTLATSPTATVGVADGFTLTATNAAGIATGYRGTVTFSSTDPKATFAGGTTYTFTAADNGVHTFTGVTFGTAGTFAITATDGTATGTANVVVSLPAPALSLTIGLTATVGVADPFTITAARNGAVATDYTGTVTFSSTDNKAAFPGGTSYTFTAADGGVHTFPGVTFGSVGTFAVNATDGTAKASTNVVVSLPAATLALAISPTATTGVADAFTITAMQGITAATGYTGTVSFSTTDPKATFPAGTSYTFTAADNGSHTFTGVIFGTAGTFAVNATDGTAKASANVVVSLPAATLGMTINPTATIGTADAFTITAMQGTAVAPGYTGTVSFSTTDPKATFPAGTSYTFTAADNGVHTFTGVFFGTPGTFAVNATDGTAKASANVVVSRPAASLAFTITPTATAGLADAFTITVVQGTVLDTGYTGTVSFTSTDPKATFPAGTTYTFTAADNGSHTFTGVVFGTAGTFAVNATDGTAKASANVVVSLPAATLALTITPTATTGVADAFTITAMQGTGIPAGYTGTVSFSSTDPKATFPAGASYTFTAADNGSHTFTGVVFGTAGTFAVNATDGTAKASANVVVSLPAATLTLAINPLATIGVADGFTITAMQGKAAATGYTGTVTLSTTDPKATIAGGTTYTFTAADQGAHTFPGVTFGTVGVFIVTATDGTSTAPGSVTVSAPALLPSLLVLTSSANPLTLGGTTTLTATAASAVAGGSAVGAAPAGTVTFSDGSTVLGTVTLANGVASLSYTLTTTGTHALTATYSGSTVYAGSSSSTVAETVGDLTLSLASNSSATATVLPGASAAYGFTVAPAGVNNFVLPVTFTATGMPRGVTMTFSPATAAAGTATTNFTLTVAVPSVVAAAEPGKQPVASPAARPGSNTGLAPAVFALALLPLLSRRRRKFVLPLLSVIALTASTFGLTGCLGNVSSGYFGQTPTTYTIVVTATSGTVSRSTNVTLTVQ